MSGRTSRYGTAALLVRDAVHHGGAWAALAATVAALAAAATVFPLALDGLESDEAVHVLDELPVGERAVLATSEGGPLKTPDETAFTLFLGELDRIATEGGPQLAAAIGPAGFVSASKPLPIVEGGDLSVNVRLLVAPGYDEHVTVTEGELPASLAHTTDAPVDIAMTEPSASAVGWTVGETRMTGGTVRVPLRLVAIVEAKDAGEHFWTLAPTALREQRAESFYLGRKTEIATVEAFLKPESVWALQSEFVIPLTTTVGYPLDASGLTGADIAPLSDQLRRFTGTTQEVGSYHGNVVAWQFRFSSGSTDAIALALDRTGATAAVTAVAVSGPIGVAGALLWLLAVLIVGRRRDGLALLASRGAGELRLRVLVGLEALVVASVGAAIGAAAVFAALGRAPALAWLVPAGLVAVASAALVVLAATPRSLRTTRGDLTTPARGHPARRIVLEGVVLVAAGVSVLLLVQRGIASTALGFDPLLAAAPLLLCLSAAVLVLRVYPVPLLAVLRRARAGRGIVAFLGAARAIRNPSAGLAAVLAIVVGLGISLFSVVVLDTVRTGVAEASVALVGADLRVSGAQFGADDVAKLDTIPGVAEAVGVTRYRGQQQVALDGEKTGIAVLFADTAALARVQHGAPGAPAPDGDLGALRDGSIPVILSTDLATALDGLPKGSGILSFAGTRLVRAGPPATTPSLGATGEWVLVDSAFADFLGAVDPRPSLALIDLDDGTDAAAVADAAHGILGADAVVLDPATAESRHESAPVVGWLQTLLATISIAMAAACAVVCILALVVAAPARARLLALLRTLGLGRAAARGIGAWELAPIAVAGTIAGCAAGVLLPHLLLPGIDLRSYTGGTVPPAITADPLLLSAVAGGFVLAVALATAIVMVTTRRLREAALLKEPVEG
jgi:putative ABC transport system permease protein